MTYRNIIYSAGCLAPFSALSERGNTQQRINNESTTQIHIIIHSLYYIIISSSIIIINISVIISFSYNTLYYNVS